MKKNEIEIGAEYVYSRSEYGTRQRVRVLSEASIQQGYGYSKKFITGSKVEVLDDTTGEPRTRKIGGEQIPWVMEVSNRTIREPWLDYAERQAAIRASRMAGARRLRDDRDARARVLLDLIPALREAGYEDIEETVRDSSVIEALRSHVEDCLEVRPSRYRENAQETFFIAPLASALEEYVDTNKSIPLKATDLLRLLQRGNIR
jgi:hypothetical protein